MYKTSSLGLPLLAPAQAQKHVTVNEALTKLDALVKLRVLSASESSPPYESIEGATFIVAADADGDWSGQDQKIARWNNGGWNFIEPERGWYAWEEVSSSHLIYDGNEWRAGIVSLTASGASTSFFAVEFEHIISPGWNSYSQIEIPPNALMFGVTGRVTSEITGEGISSWKLGIDGQNQIFGSALGIQKNSYIHGMPGTPQVFYQSIPMRLGAVGGEFSAGSVRFVLHYLQITPPAPA